MDDPKDFEGESDLPSQFTFNPLVERLCSGEGGLPENVMLTGFLGPSKKDKHVRLYLDLHFNKYLEIPTGEIVLTQPVDTRDENSPTFVFVQPDAKLQAVYTQSETVEASYLRGRIATAHLATSSPVAISSDKRIRHNGGLGVTAAFEDARAGTTFELGCYTLSGTLCLTCTRTFICPPEVL